MKLSFRTLAQLKALIFVKPYERRAPVSRARRGVHTGTAGRGLRAHQSPRSKPLMGDSQALVYWIPDTHPVLFLINYRIAHSDHACRHIGKALVKVMKRR